MPLVPIAHWGYATTPSWSVVLPTPQRAPPQQGC